MAPPGTHKHQTQEGLCQWCYSRSTFVSLRRTLYICSKKYFFHIQHVFYCFFFAYHLFSDITIIKIWPRVNTSRILSLSDFGSGVWVSWDLGKLGQVRLGRLGGYNWLGWDVIDSLCSFVSHSWVTLLFSLLTALSGLVCHSFSARSELRPFTFTVHEETSIPGKAEPGRRRDGRTSGKIAHWHPQPLLLSPSEYVTVFPSHGSLGAHSSLIFGEPGDKAFYFHRARVNGNTW